MSTLSAAIYELFQTGKTPSDIFRLLKPRVIRSGVYKVLKRFRETESALPKVRSTHESKSKNTQSHKKDARKNLNKSEKKHKEIGFRG